MAEEVAIEVPAIEAGNVPAVAPVTPAPAQVAVPAANSAWESEKKAFIRDLQNERKARQASDTAANTFKTQYEAEQRRVRALSGVDPLNPAEVEAAEVRNRFKQVVSREQLLEMAGLTEDDIASIKANREQGQQFQKMQEQSWGRHGREMAALFTKEVSAALGGEKLTERQTTRLLGAFVQECNRNPELLERYEQGDETAIKEFTAEWTEDWIKPAQRKAAAAELNQRRPLPSGKDRTVVTSAGKKIDVNDSKAVEDLLVSGFRERGGSFRNNQ